MAHVDLPSDGVIGTCPNGDGRPSGLNVGLASGDLAPVIAVPTFEGVGTQMPQNRLVAAILYREPDEVLVLLYFCDYVDVQIGADSQEVIAPSHA